MSAVILKMKANKTLDSSRKVFFSLLPAIVLIALWNTLNATGVIIVAAWQGIIAIMWSIQLGYYLAKRDEERKD